VIVINYLDGAVTLLTGGASAAWLASLNGPPVCIGDAVASWGTQEVLAYLPAPAPSPWRWRLTAVPVVLAMLAVKHAGNPARAFHRLVRLSRAGSFLPAASTESVRRAVRAVRWATRLVPARVACLEESVAAMLLLAATGKRGRWRHGIATDPIRLHAWLVDPDDVPVEEPTETAHYTTITELP
jgi:hypothetical protein